MSETPDHDTIVKRHQGHASGHCACLAQALGLATSLRTQLQQAEQERDSLMAELAEVRELKEAVHRINDGTAAQLADALIQLQQAETALRALQEAAEDMGGIDTEIGWIDVSLTSEQASAIAAGLAALAAPPPSSFCGAAHADGACNTKAAPPPNPKEPTT